MSAKWTSTDVPGQSGRVVVITGSNTGVGYEAAAVLANKGAHVVLAVRNLDKGEDAKARITATNPNANVSVQELDLASLASVRKAADELRAAHPRIDLLINNAGVMTLDKASTEDGFELQFGTNHLGHFALTGLLLENMLAVERFPRGHHEQPGPSDLGHNRFRPPEAGSLITTGTPATGSPSSPICFSPTSWPVGSRPRARRRSRWRPTLALRLPSCCATYRA